MFYIVNLMFINKLLITFFSCFSIFSKTKRKKKTVSILIGMNNIIKINANISDKVNVNYQLISNSTKHEKKTFYY